MKNETNFDPKKVFQLLIQHAQDAVGDVARAVAADNDTFDKWGKLYQQYKNYVRDPIGRLADEMYSNPDCVSDLVGDKLHDECSGEKHKMELVLAEMYKAGDLWSEVADRLK